MAHAGIINQFADEAAFLWHLRTRSVNAPHFTLDDMAGLDERIEAHVDGLRVAGDDGWNACAGYLGSGTPEVYFAPSVLAFEQGEQNRIGAVLDAVGQDSGKAGVIVSALGWLTYEKAEPHISRFLRSDCPFHRYIGIAASALHRRDPGAHLDKAIRDTSILLIARGMLAYGELGRKISLNFSMLRENLSDDDDSIRFATAWSSALAGNDKAVEVLKAFVLAVSPYCGKALNIVMRRLGVPDALSFREKLALSTASDRLAVIGAGIIGDPALIPWLMERMQSPELARVAAESFTMITGADIEQEELRGKRPGGVETGPNDDPHDCNVTLDVDDDLPWPAPELIAKWWDTHKGRYTTGIRHLLGLPISGEHLRHVLRNGRQRQRAAAALELAILEPGTPLFEVGVPAERQIELLAMCEG